MSDSPAPPGLTDVIDVRLTRDMWDVVTAHLGNQYSGHPNNRIIAREAIRQQMPETLPTKVGAVIRARRHGEASIQIYVRAADGGQPFHNVWRAVDVDGFWCPSDVLVLVEILAPGVEL